MSLASGTPATFSPWRSLAIIPFPVGMLLIAVALGLGAGLQSAEIIEVINTGFGATLGDIALILIPSFVLASAISQSKQVTNTGGIATAIAPLAGAAMVCPDTAYAALSPVSGNRKLSMMFGAYAGFKLLVPAGPAIVAVMLGGLTPTLVAWSAIVCVFAWVAGLAYARLHEEKPEPNSNLKGGKLAPAILLPLAVLILLIVAGGVARAIDLRLPALVDHLLNPKGALLIAACVSLLFVNFSGKATAMESGLKRTAPLLLTIGAASALGTMLAHVLAFDRMAQALVSTGLALPALFLLTVILKVSKGSSMATFAGTGGIVAALLPNLGVSAEAATLAMCAGAFVTIAPNDSLYWLVREDAFLDETAGRATRVLAIGATLQGFVAFGVVLVIHALGFI